jgi:hypothetical protein
MKSALNLKGLGAGSQFHRGKSKISLAAWIHRRTVPARAGPGLAMGLFADGNDDVSAAHGFSSISGV